MPPAHRLDRVDAQFRIKSTLTTGTGLDENIGHIQSLRDLRHRSHFSDRPKFRPLSTTNSAQPCLRFTMAGGLSAPLVGDGMLTDGLQAAGQDNWWK